MTLRQFLDRTEPFPLHAVRTAMVGAIAEQSPDRLQQRRSYSTFYSAVVRRLRVAGAPRLAPAQPSSSWSAGSGPAWMDDAAETTITYRRLAMRVIERAVRDMTAPVCAATDRESARVFLAGSPMLFHWCSVAEIDPRRVVAQTSGLGRLPKDEI